MTDDRTTTEQLDRLAALLLDPCLTVGEALAELRARAAVETPTPREVPRRGDYDHLPSRN
jgi:hypothetical protein